ncbi:tRNA (guanosine(46)-N7)-methyltransferase TrmB [Methylocystis sp.]|uniref:tRNA (guanosine(46)-N7)-methyltransferase TrmB n=1 Tax=Methylocystis sp. TaxID=1911079 RepID=UPI003DA49BFA
MSETSQQRGAHARLYGRSKGKALRKRQAALIDELLPRLSLDLAQPPAPTARERRLEIGFGGGEHLIAAASDSPEVEFIGCEPFLNGVAKLLTRIDERGLTNIRLHQGDAADVLDWLPEDSLSRVYLFYPDPWPKRRHHKRRFVARENLDRLARAMHADAELRFATDIDDYAAWTLARLRAHPAFRWRAQRAEDWRTPWPGWTRTKYEAKAMAEGRDPVYLTFVRALR